MCVEHYLQLHALITWCQLINAQNVQFMGHFILANEYQKLEHVNQFKLIKLLSLQSMKLFIYCVAFFSPYTTIFVIICDENNSSPHSPSMVANQWYYFCMHRYSIGLDIFYPLCTEGRIIRLCSARIYITNYLLKLIIQVILFQCQFKYIYMKYNMMWIKFPTRTHRN